MKTLFTILLVLIVADLFGQTCPTTIRVGSSCSCHTCTGTIDVVNYETYVKRVLPQEWLNCWGSQTNGMNSLQAGAVAIRSYTIPRMASNTSNHGNGSYDICTTTCCHAYGTTQYTNSNNAVDNTLNYVLVSGSTVQLTEYAAEQNNHTSCGNGYKGNGTGSWPCTTDGPCTGETYNGHGRGMCQNGSARWATGLDFVNSSCSWQSSHGYGTKTWQQILSHYYPNWTLTTCGIVTVTPPLCDNDIPCDYQSLTINTSGTCSPISCSTVNATPPSSDITYYNGTNNNCITQYQSIRYDDDVWFRITPSSNSPVTIRVTPTSNTSSFDPVIGVYQGSCSSLSQLGCADANPFVAGAAENLTFTPSSGTSYYIRVFSYGTSSATAGNFQICAFSSSCTPPSQPGSISGQTSVCQNGLHQYSVSSVSGATSYTWTLPSGWSGSGSTTNSINVSAGSASGTVSVIANNSCGSSAPRTLSVSVSQLPAQPGGISGSITVCPGQSQTYSISSVAGADSYNWTLPSGWSGSSTSTSINATPGSSGGTISVSAYNSVCGSSTARTLNVTIGSAPSQPGNISGNTFICQGVSQTYSISSVSGATSYSWSYTGSGTPNGNGTSVTFNPTSSGTLSVTAVNGCGNSAQRTLVITIDPTPAQPGSISGNTTVCAGSSQSYSINSVSGATSYTWSYSGGSSPSGSGTSVNFNPTGSGTLTVTADNNCGSSSAQTLSITVTPLATQPGINSSMGGSLCAGQSTTLDATNICSGCSYTWQPGNQSGTSISLSPSSTTQYTVSASNGCGGPVSSNTFTVNVSQLITPSVSITANPSGSICAGANISFTAFSSNGGSNPSYQWFVNGGNSVGSGTTYSSSSLSNMDQVTCQLTSDANCANPTLVTSSAYTVNVTPIPATPTISPSSPGTSCNAIPLTASSAGCNNCSYTWSTPLGQLTGATVSGSQTGTYTATASNNGCVSASSNPVSVTITNGINVSFSGLPSAMCVGDAPVTLTGSSGSSGFSGPGVSGNQFNPATAGVSTHTITYSYTDPNTNCTGTSSQTVTVGAPAPNITGNTSFCAGGSTVMNAGSGFDFYEWNSGAGSGQTFNVVSGGIYTVIVTDANGCTGTDQVTVIENALPQPVINGSTTFCAGGSTTLSVSGFSSYSWSLSGQTGNSINVSSAGCYTVTVVDANGCMNTSPQVCVIQATQLVPVITTSNGSESFCTGGSLVLSAGDYESYGWSTGGNSSTLTATSGGTYSVFVGTGSCNGTASITITENPLPVPTISGNASYCQGGSTVLDAGNGFNGYNWNQGLSIQQMLTVNAPGTYTVTVTDVNGCAGQDTETVTENPSPQPTLPSTATYCQGANTILSAPAGYSSYLWTPGGVTGQLLPVSAPACYTVEVTDANGCTGTSNQVCVSESSVLSPNITVQGGGAAAICAGGNLQLNAGPGYSLYNWSTGGIGQFLTVSSPGTYTIIVTQGGCQGTASIEVSQYPTLVANAGADQTITPPATSAPLNGNASGGSESGYSYSWSPTTGLDNPALPNPNASPNQTTDYTLTVTDGNGCTASDEVTVTNSGGCENSTLSLTSATIEINAMGSSPGTTGVSFTPSSTGCTWSVTMGSDCGWLSNISPLNPQIGNSTIQASTGPNNTGAVRTCSLTITYDGGIETVIVQQDPINETDPCEPSPLPAPHVVLNGCELSTADVAGVSYQWYVSGNEVGDTIRFHEVGQTGTYYLVITDVNGCTAQSADYFIEFVNPDCITSIGDIADGFMNLMLIPNPSNGSFELVIPNMQSQYIYEIFSPIGQIVQTGNVTTERTSIHLGEVAAGMYSFRLTNVSGQMIGVSRVVIQD
jgi:hypothetical protein